MAGNRDKMISQFGTDYNWHLSYPKFSDSLQPLPHYILTLCQRFLLLNSSKISGDSEYLPKHCHNTFIYCFPPKCKLRGLLDSYCLFSRTAETPSSLALLICPVGQLPATGQWLMRQHKQTSTFSSSLFFLFPSLFI